MASIELLNNLEKLNLIHPPRCVLGGTQLMVMMGSHAYGVAELHKSDFDIYGFCIPDKSNVFPHLSGQIIGFGKQIQRFEQWSEHHVNYFKKEYDFSIYSIIKYFQLVMENNPNCIDSLFVPADCILHETSIGRKVRENRQLFLHKGSFHKFRGYAFSQLHKIKTRKPIGKRMEIVEEHEWDVKHGYHLLRLVLETEQILLEHDLDLRKNKELLKEIRRGEWTIERVEEYFVQKEKQLDQLYHDSTLRYGPDEEKIKNLLLECLEDYYGSIDSCIVEPDKLKMALQAISEICNKVMNA